MNTRAEYPIKIMINQKKLNSLVIDQHYKEKRSDLNDKIIMELVKSLDGQNLPIEERKDGFEYMRVEPVFHNDKPYRLILVMYIHEDYIGVINAFRVRRK